MSMAAKFFAFLMVPKLALGDTCCNCCYQNHPGPSCADDYCTDFGNLVNCTYDARTSWKPVCPDLSSTQPLDDCCNCCYVGHSGPSCAGKQCMDHSTGNGVMCNHEAHTEPIWPQKYCKRDVLKAPLLDDCCQCCWNGQYQTCAGELCMNPSTGYNVTCIPEDPPHMGP